MATIVETKNFADLCALDSRARRCDPVAISIVGLHGAMSLLVD
jgi:hypothetical protein